MVRNINDRYCNCVDDVLRRFSGARAFIPYFAGNNGDTLIRMGSMRAIQQAGIKPIQNLKRADFIIIYGGGGMNQLWGSQLKPFMHYINAAKDIPLVILPSSYYACGPILKTTIQKSRQKIIMFAREHQSKELLINACMDINDRVEVHLDHDMAFTLSNTDILNKCHKIRSHKLNRHILVVDRGDAESSNSKSKLIRSISPGHSDRKTQRFARSTLGPIRRWSHRAYKTLSQQRYSKGCSSQLNWEVENVIEQKWPEFEHLPRVFADASNHLLFSFSEFLEMISSSAVIFTTRLHAGILGAILGIPVVLKDGRIGKLKNVYL